MLRHFQKTTGWLLIAGMVVMYVACFSIISVDQPVTAETNTTIDVTLQVGTDPNPIYDDGYHYGIVGFLIPLDWSVNEVRISGSDLEPSDTTFSFLHPDSSDNEPDGNVNFWEPELNNRFPPPMGMHWVVYQSDDSIRTIEQTTTSELSVQFVTGSSEGNFNIGYFVTNAALDFDEEEYYDVSLENSITVSGASAIDHKQPVPDQYRLSQNYPNPFNPVTRIRYALPKASDVILTLHDMQGKQLRMLHQGYMPAGVHQLEVNAADLASGVYLYKMTAGNFISARKLMVVK